LRDGRAQLVESLARGGIHIRIRPGFFEEVIQRVLHPLVPAGIHNRHLRIGHDKADTLYMTEDGFAKASNAASKELFLIPGATHIQTYYVPEYVDQAVARLSDFFGKEISA